MGHCRILGTHTPQHTHTHTQYHANAGRRSGWSGLQRQSEHASLWKSGDVLTTLSSWPVGPLSRGRAEVAVPQSSRSSRPQADDHLPLVLGPPILLGGPGGLCFVDEGLFFGILSSCTTRVGVCTCPLKTHTPLHTHSVTHKQSNQLSQKHLWDWI